MYASRSFALASLIRFPFLVLGSCGHRFQIDHNALMFGTIASLSIQRLSPDAFSVEQSYAGTKTDLGPMTEAELWAYLTILSGSVISNSWSQLIQNMYWFGMWP